MYEENKNNKSRSLLVFGCIFLAFEIASMLLLTYIFIKFPILPDKYWVLYTIVSGLLMCITAVLLLNHRSVGRYVVGVLFSLVISVMYLLAFFMLSKARGTLNNITGGNNNQPVMVTNQLVIMVRNDDPATDGIKQVIDDNFGCQNTVNYERTKSMINYINTYYQADINVVEYVNYSRLANALLDGSVRAIIVDKNDTKMLEENDEDFYKNVRVLEEIEFSMNITPRPVVTTEPKPTVPAEEYPKTPFKVYISGIDVYGEIDKRSRSDVNLIVTVNPETKKVLILTTSRDTYTTIPGITGDQKDKLTHAALYGVDKSIATLEQIYDTKIDYYLRANFSSMEDFIDIIGGIDVYCPQDFVSLHTKDVYTEGIMHMDGKLALEFVRERYAFPDGDRQRGRNQIAVLKLMIEKMMSPVLLTKFSEIMDVVDGNFQTDMSMDLLTSLVRMQLDNPAQWSIETYAVDCHGDHQMCFSYDAKPLYVSILSEESLEEAKTKMEDIMQGR